MVATLVVLEVDYLEVLRILNLLIWEEIMEDFLEVLLTNPKEVAYSVLLQLVDYSEVQQIMLLQVYLVVVVQPLQLIQVDYLEQLTLLKMVVYSR